MKEARIYFGDAGLRMIAHGDFVHCAVTGDKIHVEQLRYWSVARQEAYKDAQTSLLRHQGDR